MHWCFISDSVEWKVLKLCAATDHHVLPFPQRTHETTQDEHEEDVAGAGAADAIPELAVVAHKW